MLVVWACFMPALASAHELEHSFDDDLHTPVLCACAAFADRDDDEPIEPFAALIASPPASSEHIDEVAESVFAPIPRVSQAIRAPPAR